MNIKYDKYESNIISGWGCNVHAKVSGVIPSSIKELQNIVLEQNESAIIARELGLQVGGAGYDFEGKWRDKGLFAYHTGKYAGCAYFGIGGTADEELEQKGGGDKYRLWEVNDPNMPNSAREKWRKIEHILARSYYLYPPK